MRKKRLMVLDDRILERKDIYQTVLDPDFDLLIVEKASEVFDTIEAEQVDGYILDMVLTNWLDRAGKRMAMTKVLELIGKTLPVFLVSNEYKYLIQEGELTDLLNEVLDSGYKIRQFFLWDEFSRCSIRTKDDLNPVVNAIKMGLATHNKLLANDEAFNYDLGVVAALGEELLPFLQHMHDVTTFKFERISCNLGHVITKGGNKIKVVAVQQEEMGTVDTAIISASIVKQFNLNYLVMIGVCGGRDGKVGIGDIIVPNEIVAYQKGKIGEDGLSMDIDISKSNVNARMTFSGKCDNIIENLFKTYMLKLVEEGATLELKKPILHFNEMACGENVVNKSGELENIALAVNKPKLCAIDMETYSIFRMNNFMDVSTLVIKSVMDLSSNKSDKYKSYAAFIASNFLYHVLYEEVLDVKK